MEKGYRIDKIYEVYHWAERTQYDPKTGKGGLFAEYVNTFLKIKQEASGWPGWCESDEQKQNYIDNYFLHEGITLDWQAIEVNKGLRSLAKLSLNSFWGKFAQRTNLVQTKLIRDAAATSLIRQKTSKTFTLSALTWP